MSQVFTSAPQQGHVILRLLLDLVHQHFLSLGLHHSIFMFGSGKAVRADLESVFAFRLY
jgi:hypothetical protein